MNAGHAPWRSGQKLGVLGMGHAVPGPAIATADLVAMMNTRFGFTRGREASVIASRMGIEHRHICRPFEGRHEEARAGDGNPELAARALRVALDQAGLEPDDLGYLIGHTTTPAQPLPANITLVADLLRYGGPHVELRQACTGFANALMIACGLVASGGRPVAIVGSETGSLFLDPADLDADAGQIVNLIQMGDGAGAIIVGAPVMGCATITASWYGACGLDRSPGISRRHTAHRFDHDFAAIRLGGKTLFEAGLATVAGFGIDIADIEHIVPHQVSGRIGAQLAAHSGLLPERMFVNAGQRGNTGSAAIWIALAELCSRLTPGERVVVLGAEASKYMYGGFAYEHG